MTIVPTLKVNSRMEKELFTEKNICRTMYDEIESNIGCVAILKGEVLCEAHRTSDNQLVRLKGGYGCDPGSYGQACFVKFCKDGKTNRLERYDFIGIADEETTAYAEELERKYEEKITLSEAEKEVLVECNQDALEMYKVFDETFHTDESNHLRTIHEDIQKKLGHEGVKIPQFNKLELMNLAACLAHHAELKITVAKNNGLDPKQDKEILFLNGLYIKLHTAFLEAKE